MTNLKIEVWATGPRDTKAHLYIEDGADRLRRLCHRARVDRTTLSLADNADDRCRLCLNIRGLIVTRRHKRKVSAR